MKKALISPIEKIYFNNGTVGSRVAQVTDAEFPVAAPLFWIDCVDECVADKWYYSDSDNKLYVIQKETKPEANTA